MPVLNCDLRDDSVTIKALRRALIAPGVIYGKNLKETVKIQVPYTHIAQLMRENSLGSQITVVVGETTYVTMLKKVDYIHMTNVVQHVDFQVLTMGEKIKTSAPIHFINKDKVSIEGSLQERQSAIEYEVLPSDIIDFFEVDLAGLALGDDIKLQDLAVSNDPKFNFITPMNTSLVSLVMSKVAPTVVAAE